MKAIVQPNGTVEIDGTPEEIAAYVKANVPAARCTCGTLTFCLTHPVTYPSSLTVSSTAGAQPWGNGDPSGI